MTDATPASEKHPALDPSDIDVWIFDLDNTLYSPKHDLFSQIDRKMGEFIADFLGLEWDDAKLLQKSYFRSHGTTLRGLMLEHGMAPEAFLDYVHDIDLSVIPADPSLNRALARLGGRKYVFTNASRGHAERITRHLGIDSHFEAIFDIVESDYLPKPDPRPYEKLLDLHAIPPTRTVMVEDIARNLKPAAEMGMTTVWVPNPNHWATEGADDGHIDHVVEDLAVWLSELAPEHE